MQPVVNNACNENTELSADRIGLTGSDKCMNEDINGQTTEDENSEMINKNTANPGLTNDNNWMVRKESDDKGTGVVAEYKESSSMEKEEIESETDRNADSNGTNRELNVGNAELTNDSDKTLITGEELEKNEKVEDEDSELQEKTKGPERRRRRFFNLIDSDSEDEPVFPATVDKERVESEDEDAPKKLSSKQKHKSKKKKVFSDSEDEQISIGSKKSKSKKKRVVSNDIEDNGNNKEDDEKEEASRTTFRLQTLIDSESEGEEQTQTFTREVPEGQKSAKKVKEKKRMGSIRAAKEEAMKQIHSESQRLIRQSEISLPYHVPKQRTLEEFLSRKKVSAALPKAPTMAAKLKMSSAIVNEVLEEKEKEAELFYKSSDSEDENTQNTLQQKSEALQKDSTGNSTQNFAETSDKDATKSKDGQVNNEEESPAIEATQKLTKQVQDFHKKKEIIQQGNACLGAPRKLFDADCVDINDDLNDVVDEIFNEDFIEKTTDTLGEEDANPENRAKMILKSKEQRKDRREGSVPRKLFGMFVETEEMGETRPEEVQSSEKGQPSNNAEEPNQPEDISEIIETPHVNKKDLVTSLHKDEGQNCGENGGVDEEILKLMTEELDDIASDTDLAKNKEDSGLSSMNSDLVKLADQIENEDAMNGLERADEQENGSSKSKKDATSEESSSYANTVRNCLGIDKLDDYNEYGLPPPVFEEDIAKSGEKQHNKRSSIKAKLLSKLPPLEPKIKGNPGMMIDLTADVKPKQEGVDKLLDRFFCKHSKPINKQVENSDVSVICVEETSNGPVATKQKLPYKVPEVKVESKELCKPGAKLQRLKEELELKMAMRRDEEWKLKEEEMKNDEEAEEEAELSLEDKQEEIEDDEEEAETEPEEDDIVIKERKRKRCAFADEEAEVSEGDGENDEDDADFEDDEQSDQECTKKKKKRNARGNSFADEVDEDTEDLEEDDEEEDEDNEELGTRRKLKRIIKPFEEDSNMSNATSTENDVEAQRDETSKNSEQTDTLSKYVKEKEDGNEENFCKNERENVTQKKEGKGLKHIMDFFKSDIKLKRKEEKEEDEVEQYMALSQKVREKASFSRTTTDMDIFASENEEGYAQDKELEFSQTPLNKGNILDLISPATQLTVLSAKLDSSKKDEYFSGKSTVTPMKRTSLQKKLFDDSPEMNDEDLLNLCSGKFSLERTNSEGKQYKDGKQTLYQSEEPEMTDSQLVALCSGTFNTPVFKQGEKRDSYEKNDAKEKETEKKIPESGTALRLVSSDEEEEETFVAGRRKKRTWKKLDLSDESEEENSSNSDEEEEEEEEMNKNFEDPEDEEKFVDYDSEENEVVVVPKKEMRKYAAGFFEDEAELSDEEDYEGSDDEDERGLDQLEMEEGDAEEIDEDKMRSQLGKLHMKQILDEDQRDVRILKEILFEDGDLHTDGSGRERKFRWRNIDKLGEEKDGQVTSVDKDGWLDVPEDENEIEWRKMRHEREKFLAEKKKELDDEIEAELNDCEIFKLGVKALKKIEINQSLRQSNSPEIPEPTQPKTCHTISDLLNTSDVGGKSRTIQSVMQKRSLLARSEESLARIAMLARQNEPSILAKNARNFVFKHISPSVIDEEENNSENIESKFQETNLSSKYRKRKATSNATPRSAKKTKMDVESRGKKLF